MTTKDIKRIYNEDIKKVSDFWSNLNLTEKKFARMLYLKNRKSKGELSK